MATNKVTVKGEDIKIDVKTVKHEVNLDKVEYKVSLSRTGGQGAANNTLGGIPVEVLDAENGDLLTIDSNKWVNVRRTTITDGGNF